jgi:hypothetical protein
LPHARKAALTFASGRVSPEISRSKYVHAIAPLDMVFRMSGGIAIVR